jgi:hypothetical protein
MLKKIVFIILIIYLVALSFIGLISCGDNEGEPVSNNGDTKTYDDNNQYDNSDSQHMEIKNNFFFIVE